MARRKETTQGHKLRSEAEKARNKANYRALRAAGFDTAEAARLRNAKQSTVNAALESHVRPVPMNEKHAVAGRGLKYNPEVILPQGGYHKGRIKNSDYQWVTPGQTYMYHSTYAYVMVYTLRHVVTGEGRTKYYTILSPEKMTKSKLIKQIIIACEKNQEINDYWELVKNSIHLVAPPYYNPHPMLDGTEISIDNRY